MLEILKSFFTNQIVVDWIAPIITGLIVLAIPGITIRIFQIRKDEKKVNEANQRYLNSIRPYIIQKINIDKDFITDVRRVVIRESCIKEKYIYTEIDLRNKLILDITEDNYINEINKKELIDFAYEVFEKFIINEVKNKEINKGKINSFMMVDKFLILFVINLVVCVIIQLTSTEGTDLQDNMTFTLCYVASFFSFCILLISNFNKLLKSKVSNESNLKDKIINLFIEEVEEKEDLKKKKRDNNL